ncbi:MAG: DMT family transporter [Pseudomonadota bacterium]
MPLWITCTLLAAGLQALRTAAQKQLATTLSPMGATAARYVFGLPVAAAYLGVLLFTQGDSVPALNGRFAAFAIASGALQIFATAAMITVFSRRNFAVGTAFAKTEALQSALFGFVFFGAVLGALDWAAVAIGVAGMLALSANQIAGGQWRNPSTLYGIASGAAFGFTALWLREASLALEGSPLVTAATTLVFMVTVQTAMCVVWLALREPGQLRALARLHRLGWFVGLTSALGSAGWFTAMTLENVALVKTVGQIEILFTLAITRRVFKEAISGVEYLGIALVVLSVVLVVI